MKEKLRKRYPAGSAIIEMVAATLLLPVSIVIYGAKNSLPDYKDYIQDLYRVVFNKGQARYYWTQ